MEVMKEYNRGDIVPWERIEQAAGFERYTLHWSAFSRRFRRDYMRQTGICLWPVGQNGGLELLTKDKQLTWRAAKRRLKAVRQFSKDRRELQSMPDADLTDRQRVIKARQLEACSKGRREALRQVRVTQALCKPTSSGQPRPISLKATAAA
jgi:hypothetical protein